MTPMTLTDEQAQAVELAVASIKAGTPMYRIGGYAGTGKTTIIHQILANAGKKLIVCAYTGKAACVLRNKGIPDARTIHSCIYRHEDVEVPNPKDPTKKIREQRWMRIEREDLKADGFIIDEASMVGKELLDDLQAFGLPIVAVGDPGQLPPISKSDVNLMLEPDIVLSKIHRQAEGSGIIQLATRIRTESPDFVRNLPALEMEDVCVRSKTEVRQDPTADVFICGYNKTRGWLNRSVRRRLEFEAPLEEGERIICLSNDRNLGVFNGLMGTVKALHGTEPRKLYPRYEEPIDVTLHMAMVLWDGETESRLTPLSSVLLGSENKIDFSTSSAHFNQAVICDYGYAITCHKSQGSAWDRVVILNEAAPQLWDQRRWLYTAVTRAAKSLAVGHENL